MTTEYWKWNPAEYGLDVTEMDEEHQALIGTMNLLFTQYEAKAPREQLDKTLLALADVTARHFANEEAFMERIGFPDRVLHRSLHQRLLNKLSRFVLDFQTKGVLTDELFAFLTMWLKAHILGIDVKYAAHFKRSLPRSA